MFYFIKQYMFYFIKPLTSNFFSLPKVKRLLGRCKVVDTRHQRDSTIKSLWNTVCFRPARQTESALHDVSFKVARCKYFVRISWSTFPSIKHNHWLPCLPLFTSSLKLNPKTEKALVNAVLVYTKLPMWRGLSSCSLHQKGQHLWVMLCKSRIKLI